MKRLDSRVSLMVATDRDADVIEAILKDGPLMLLVDDEMHTGGSFQVVILDESERYAGEAEAVLSR